MGDYHVRFREKFGVKLPLSTRPKWDCKYHLVFAPKYRRQVISKMCIRDSIITEPRTGIMDMKNMWNRGEKHSAGTMVSGQWENISFGMKRLV